MHILVIDHSKVFRSMWERLALNAGHDSVMVASGTEGLDALRERAIDIVCASHTLEDMDGVAFSRRMRALPNHSNTPLILITATADAAIRRAAFDAGATEIHDRADLDHLLERAVALGSTKPVESAGRVLYIEDSPTVATVMLRVLKDMALTVDHYTSASDAHAAFDPALHDLIISDIVVEGEMNGVGLVRRIRADYPEAMRIPILAISGMEDKNSRLELFELGVNDFVTKPVLDEEVRARVRNLMANKQLLEQVEQQRQHLYELATTDQLTGLYNRNSLTELINRPLAAANRHDLDLSVILLDIDHFKAINDTHGHLIGDEVLAAVGERVLSECRTEDYAIRFGGEELLLILPHCDIHAACSHAERLREHITTLRPAANLSITASFGVTARAKGETATLEGLINEADQACYRAKDNGRNRVEHHSQQDDPTIARSSESSA